MTHRETKRLSCKRCHRRKIRCSRTDPCISCSRDGVDCEFKGFDSKRPPISHEYVATLETRVASLETFLALLKSAPSHERDSMIRNLPIADSPSPVIPSLSEDTPSASRTQLGYNFMTSLQETREGSLTYHGPTSIYNGDLSRSRSQPNAPSLPLALVSLDCLHSPSMSECIGLFFHWQYSQFMFIDREAFIVDYMNVDDFGQYCSPALVFAICAMGALMSPNVPVKQQANDFSTTAQRLLFQNGLGTPHITSVQALLCCAFYEVGRGDFSKGWLYSGMAFRMGQDLGIQRDPKHWTGLSRVSSPTIDLEFRRRVYWGCFVSDKLFSLFLGRPIFFYESDADVETSEPLPQEMLFSKWCVEQGLEYLRDPTPVIPKLTLVFNQQVELSRIIHDFLGQVFTPSKDKGQGKQWTELSLSETNTKLARWRENLPSDMMFKKSDISADMLQPNVYSLHMNYHATRISLNRPFLSREPPDLIKFPEAAEQFQFSRDICEASTNSILSIFQHFKTRHSLRNAPLSFVLGVIIAINATITIARGRHPEGIEVKDTVIPEMDALLAEMSHTWALAGDSRNKFRKTLFSRQRPVVEAFASEVQASQISPKHSQLTGSRERDSTLNFPDLLLGLGPSAEEDESYTQNMLADPHSWEPFAAFASL